MLNSITFDFSHVDTSHWIIIVLGYVIVFIALTLLVYLFVGIPKLLSLFNRSSKKGSQQAGSTSVDASPISGEVNAAIAAAIYLYLDENHDIENNKMTIKRAARTYSPWNSKLYGLNNMYHRKNSR